MKTHRIRIAAYQAPLADPGFMDNLARMQTRVAECEAAGVQILCCPEAVLGGLADYAARPSNFAMSVNDGSLSKVLEPLANENVASIIGFTELGNAGELYNSAVIYSRGAVHGIYRKLNPAIHRSVYSAGVDTPIFRIGALAFGIVICYDSTFAEPASRMARQGARVLFVPTNNSLPISRASPQLSTSARACDIARATENQLWIVRADVAGESNGLISHGASEIVSPDGFVVKAAAPLAEDLIMAELTFAE